MTGQNEITKKMERQIKQLNEEKRKDAVVLDKKLQEWQATQKREIVSKQQLDNLDHNISLKFTELQSQIQVMTQMHQSRIESLELNFNTNDRLDAIRNEMQHYSDNQNFMLK